MVTIYGKDGTVKVQAPCDDNSTQTHELQGDNVLTLSFTLYAHVALEVGDYADFMGGRYWLMEAYRPEQASTVEWKYDVKMYGLENLANRFLVLNQTDGGDEPVFTLTAPASEHLKVIIDSINAGMDGAVELKLGEVVETDYIVMDYAGTYCGDALKALAEKAGAKVEWWFDGMYANLCRCERGEEVTLGYGKGLTALSCDKADNAKFYTRLYPLGSTRNIDPEKYGHTRLQLPGGVQHVDVNVDKYGVWHRFEEAAFKDIYPKYTGTVSSVRSEERKNDDGTPYTVWFFKDDGLPFNPNEYEIGGKVKRVSFQEGSNLAGLGTEEDGTYYFEANFDSSTREWEIITVWPYGDGTQLPNASLCPKTGDKYIPWNFRMPDEYYPLAEQEFKEAVDAFNEENAVDVGRYKGPTDHVYIEAGGIDLYVGRRVRLESAQYFPETGFRSSRITKITRKVNMPSQADVEICDAASRGTLEAVGDDIDDARNTIREATMSFPDIVRTGDRTPPSDSNVFSALRSLATFLRKDKADTTRFPLSLLGGAVFGSDGFASGMSGFGARIDDNGEGEMESLTVRRELIVPQLSYNRVDIKVGDKWRAPGGGVIASVDTAARRCTLRLAEGEIGAIAKDDICMGIFHSEVSADNSTDDYDDSKGNRRFAGFTTVYFRIMTVEGERNEAFTYLLRPAEEGHWTGQAEPFAEMQFVAYGNFSKTDRQTSVYETRTYTRMLWKQNTWEIGKANIALQYGDLSNLSVFEMQMQGYSMYLNSVYFTGEITQVKPDGTPVRTANDRGAWEAGHYDYYDRVSHGGCLWLCVAEGGTDTEPADGNAAWLKQVDKGAQGDSIKGDPGATLYTWVAYSDNADGSPMYTQPKDTTRYVGIAANKETPTPGTDPKEYTWLLFKGANGRGIESVTNHYAVSASGTQAPTSWQATPPQTSEASRYLWNYETITYTDGTTEDTEKRVIGTHGAKGDSIKGDDGRGIQSITEYYLATAQASGVTTSTQGWTTAVQTVSAEKKYLWNYETITYTDGASEKSTPVIIGMYSTDGQPGKDGTSPVMLGQWKTGTHVPYLGLVRMGGSTWCCTAASGTDNPPLWTLTDAEGNRLTDPEGYYLLTGEENSAEYKLVAEDGQDGKPGDKGDPGADGKGIKTVTNYYAVSASGTQAPTSWQTTPPATDETNRYLWHYSVTAYTDGTTAETPKAVICVHGVNGEDGLNGCAIRESEWTAGTDYRNDEGLASTPDGARYLDIVLVRNDAVETGWDAYRCKTSHRSSASLTYTNTEYWDKFDANIGAIFTSLIIAKNAKIRFLQGNQITVEKPDGTVTAGMSGSQDGAKTRFWAGSATADSAPFRVDEKGKLTASNAEVTGTVNATAGRIGGFAIGTTTLGAEDSDADTTVYAGNAAKSIYTAMGATAMPTLSATTVGKFINEQNWGTAWHIHAPNYGVWISARGTKQDIALAFDGGCVQGFAMKTRIVTSSVTLARTDYNIITTNSAAITITLPRMEMYDDGHVLRFKFVGGGTVNIKVQSCVTIASTSGQYASAGRVSLPTLMYDDDSTLDAAGGAAYQITTAGKAMELVWVRDLNVTRGSTRYYGAWVQYKMPASW